MNVLNLKTACLIIVCLFNNSVLTFANSNVTPEACYTISEKDAVLASKYLPKLICFNSLSVNINAFDKISVFSENSNYNNYFQNLKLIQTNRIDGNVYAYKADANILDLPGSGCEESVKINLRLEGTVDSTGHGNPENQTVYLTQITKLDSCHSNEFSKEFKFERTEVLNILVKANRASAQNCKVSAGQLDVFLAPTQTLQSANHSQTGSLLKLTWTQNKGFIHSSDTKINTSLLSCLKTDELIANIIIKTPEGKSVRAQFILNSNIEETFDDQNKLSRAISNFSFYTSHETLSKTTIPYFEKNVLPLIIQSVETVKNKNAISQLNYLTEARNRWKTHILEMATQLGRAH